MAGFNVNGDRQTVTVGGEQVEASKAYFDHQSQSWKYWFQLTAAEYAALSDTDKNNPDYTFIIEENNIDKAIHFGQNEQDANFWFEGGALFIKSDDDTYLKFSPQEIGIDPTLSNVNKKATQLINKVLIAANAARLRALINYDLPHARLLEAYGDSFKVEKVFCNFNDSSFESYLTRPLIQDFEEDTATIKRFLNFIYKNRFGSSFLEIVDSKIVLKAPLFANDYSVLDLLDGAIKDYNNSVGRYAQHLETREKNVTNQQTGTIETTKHTEWVDGFVRVDFPESETAPGNLGDIAISDDAIAAHNGTEWNIFTKSNDKTKEYTQTEETDNNGDVTFTTTLPFSTTNVFDFIVVQKQSGSIIKVTPTLTENNTIIATATGLNADSGANLFIRYKPLAV